MSFLFDLARRPSSFSSARTSSTPSSSPPASPALSHASTSSTFDLLEPVSPSELPHLFVVERSLAAPSSMPKSGSSSRSHHHHHRHHTHEHKTRRPPCTLNDAVEGEKQSIFSFPRNHTTHLVCPRHGIVHDPALAIPERDSRDTSSGSSTRSSSRCSEGSGRSIMCALRRMKKGESFSSA
ncbi:hypothetical protein JCM8547_006518 [Rhodosporidiobolus lusitaniae]